MADAASVGLDELYAYDGLYRLISATRGTLNSPRTAIQTAKFAQCWTLDATGNWKAFREDDNGDGTWDLIQSRSANQVNEISGVTNSVGSAWATPAYNAAGNMTTIPQPADPTKSYTGTYDAWSRLVKVVNPLTSQTVQTSAYDGRNYRTIRNSYAAGVLSETRHYFYTSSWQVLEERVGASAIANRQFIWGLRFIDDLVLRDRDTTGGGTLNERLYALQDPLGSVVATVNASGAVQERYAFAPYGAVTFLSPAFGATAASAVAWETLFASYRLDANTGLHVVRERQLNYSIGAWLTGDPLAADIYVATLYEYVGSSPVNVTDPTGLKWPLSYESGDKVCGYDIWLLTGNWCSDPQVVLDATDAHEAYTRCWFRCEGQVHRTVCGKVLVATEVVAGPLALLGARVPKEWAGLEPLFAEDPFTSVSRAIATRLGPDPAAGNPRGKLVQLGRDFGRGNIAKIAKGGVVVVAIIEATIAWTCSFQCGK